MNKDKHEHYELMNLIGYGLAKFDVDFMNAFGFGKKKDSFNYIVSLEIADAEGVVKNRQDLLDPFFSNGKKDWRQKGDAYIHRKISIDSMFGDMDVPNYANVVKYYIHKESKGAGHEPGKISPIVKSRFRQLQQTGPEAELYFKGNYRNIDAFSQGAIEDGYDFQIQGDEKFFLAEIKGVRGKNGSVRLTDVEFDKANE